MKGNGRRPPRRIPEVLDPQEQRQLLAQLEPTDTISKLRNLAMLRIFLNCGLRSSELCALKIPNIDWKTGRMKVRGKGDKERILWLSDDDMLLLRNWLDRRPSSDPPSGNLVFTSLDGKKPICGRWLRQFVKRIGEQAGIKKDCHPHLLRHCFACRILTQTKNIFLVSKALGHANLATTEIYLHLVDGELEAAMKTLGSNNAK
jgi:site-specific recombinase XerD